MKNVLKITANIIAWIILIFAMLVTIIVFTADRNNGVASLLGYVPLTVESDSMAPTFNKNDLIISHKIDDVSTLEKGDVITFWTLIDGKKVKNSHRIVEINNVEGNLNFITRGDANPIDDELLVYPVDIIGKWTDVKISGFGKVMDFLRTKKGFFICILLPIILFFLYELYRMIVTIIEIKRPEISETQEEEIKRKAIEEYLAQQKDGKQNEEAAENKVSEEKK